MSNEAEKPPVIGITVGDLNGIGMEVIIKTLREPGITELCTPVVFGSSKTASYHRKAIDAMQFSFQVIRSIDQLHVDKPNLLNCWEEEVNLDFGTVDKAVGAYALKSLQAACQAYDEGHIDALVTAPIHKESIQSEDFRFSGHTDYLEARYKSKATMLLMSDEMRMALTTVHIPLAKVTELLSTELIHEKIKSVHQSLKQDFLIPKGKIAVLAVNPHAGDAGVMGNEDKDMVAPAIEKACEEGMLVFGPYPSDSFFGSGNYRKFDAILAMYHDQGLIPFKSLSFGRGVNYSAGLPLVRCSPDHGTAFEIAGKGIADASSFREAIYAAIDLVKNRKVDKDINANPLKNLKKHRKDY